MMMIAMIAGGDERALPSKPRFSLPSFLHERGRLAGGTAVVVAVRGELVAACLCGREVSAASQSSVSAGLPRVRSSLASRDRGRRPPVPGSVARGGVPFSLYLPIYYYYSSIFAPVSDCRLGRKAVPLFRNW